MAVTGDACQMSDVPSSPGKIMLVHRGGCPFLNKAYNVFNSRAIAMVVIDHADRDYPPIMASGSELVPFAMIKFVSIAIPYDEGERLKKLIDREPDTLLQISYLESDDYDIERVEGLGGRVVSYTCGIAISALLLVMATRMCNRHPRAAMRPRVAISREPEEVARADELMESLHSYEFSTAKYLSSKQCSNGDVRLLMTQENPHEEQQDKDDDEDDPENELPTCCVCLANFEDGERVLKLPCKHEFHADCIGAWLRMHVDCPLCKADVYEMHFNSPLAAVNPLALQQNSYDPVAQWVEGLSNEPSPASVREEPNLNDSQVADSSPPSPTRTLSWDGDGGTSIEEAANQIPPASNDVVIHNESPARLRLEHATVMEVSI